MSRNINFAETFSSDMFPVVDGNPFGLMTDPMIEFVIGILWLHHWSEQIRRRYFVLTNLLQRIVSGYTGIMQRNREPPAP